MFTEWFNQKYRDWRGDRYGRDASVSAFSRFLCLNQQAVDGYLKGSIPRDAKIVHKIADKLGSEVFEEIDLYLKIDRKIVFEINQLPIDLYPELIKQIRELRAKYNSRKSLRKETSDLQDE